ELDSVVPEAARGRFGGGVGREGEGARVHDRRRLWQVEEHDIPHRPHGRRGPRVSGRTAHGAGRVRLGGRGVSRVVVAEKLSPAGLDLLRKAGHEVVDLAGVPREALLAALADALAGSPREQLLAALAAADALLVRSATKVDAALFAAAPKLTVVGRAGVGVD